MCIATTLIVMGAFIGLTVLLVDQIRRRRDMEEIARDVGELVNGRRMKEQGFPTRGPRPKI